MHRASVIVSDRMTEDEIGSRGGRPHHHHRGGDRGAKNGGGGPVRTHHRVTSVAVWETPSSGGSPSSVKLFTGSHDGKWRLYNIIPPPSTNSPNGGGGATLIGEFEHRVGGPVECVHVASPFFFAGFEACPIVAPDARAGMVHGWNLDRSADPPLELWMSGSARYAGSGKIKRVCTREDGRLWSGGHDGVIREWTYAPQLAGMGGFALVRGMGGHLGAVTGLALSKGTGVLWSGGMDGTVRLWNVETGEPAHAIPAIGKGAARGGGGNNGIGGPSSSSFSSSSSSSSSSSAASAPIAAPAGAGHSGPVTGLLPFELPGGDDASSGGGGPSSSSSPPSSFVFTSSLDETVKVWNATNGECVASERHGQGVTSIALSSDLRGNPLLLCGLYYGDIMIRGTVSNPPLCLLLKISHNFLGVGHEIGPVNDIQPGPGNTFYAVADDGKLTAWQITGDFGL